MKLLLALCMIALVSTAAAEIKTQVIEYQDGETTLEGYLAYNTEVQNAPGVMIVHQWMGQTDHERESAKKLAGMGYVAFACDIYGKGMRPADSKEAGQYASKYRGGDRENFRARLKAGLDKLKSFEQVDADHIAAIGYCFGGTGVLEIARMGADVDGVASFHGGLSAATPAKKGDIKTRVLVLHGAVDPYSPMTEVTALVDELNAADANYELDLYSSAVHSFTDKGADSEGARYNAQADARSWKRMSDFLEEVFGE